MKKPLHFLAAAIGAIMLLSGCSENAPDDSEAEVSVSESIFTELAETELTGSETTVSETEAAAAETSTETTAEAAAEPEASETETETESENEDIQTEGDISDTFSDMSVDEMLELINANSKTVGNDTCGYITVYAGSEYEENENGSYTVTSETGTISVFRFDYDFTTDLDTTAYMICLTAAMNAEVDGYEMYDVNYFSVDGMDGYFAVMVDNDTDLGFMMYAAVIDNAETIRGMSCECREYTLENIVAQGWAFDSYRRSLSA